MSDLVSYEEAARIVRDDHASLYELFVAIESFHAPEVSEHVTYSDLLYLMRRDGLFLEQARLIVCLRTRAFDYSTHFDFITSTDCEFWRRYLVEHGFIEESESLAATKPVEPTGVVGSPDR